MDISMSVPLVARSEAAISKAIDMAVEAAVRRAVAMGFPSVKLLSAHMGLHHLDVKLRVVVANESDKCGPNDG
jgi:hypothetical protein